MKKLVKYLMAIVLVFCSFNAHAQKMTISGVVTDENNKPFPGVSVIIDGTLTGTMTSDKGGYEIAAPKGSVLLFDCMGYKQVKVTVADKTVYNVKMEVSSEMLEELVVVGYGVQKKVNVTGSVATVDYSDLALSRPATTTSGLLQGASAGLYVYQNSGKPGSEGVTMRIRGVGTLSSAGSDPLVIVDGFEGSMNGVNPSDIETISILKDAASCAIYGNRGANGVILITTKKAAVDKFTIEYNGIVAHQEPENHIEVISNYADYMTIMNESAVNVNKTPLFSQTMIDLWREKEKDPHGISDTGYPNYVAYPNVDWMDAMFINTVYQKHTLSASGASKKIRFNISASYLDNPGVIDNSGLQRFSLRSNVSADITDWIEIGVRAYGYREDTNVGGVDDASTYMSRAVPCIYPYYDGKYGWMENAEQNSASRNNLYHINRIHRNLTRHYINATAYLNVSLPLDIKYHASFNYIQNEAISKTHDSLMNAYSFSRDQWPKKFENPADLMLTYEESHNTRWTFQTNFSYNKTFAGKHDVGAIVGFEAFESVSDPFNARKKGWTSMVLDQMNNITDVVYVEGAMSDFASASVFGRATYAYDGRYMAEVNLRYDGSSRFASRSRWGFFPSVSAGWRISKEPFMEGTGIDNLKLRASWGRLGNNSIGNYDYISTYSTGYNYSFGNKLTEAMVATVTNEALEWETTETTDVGIDFAVLNNRLTLEADYYNKHTYGILYAAPIYATIGNKGAPLQNLCAVTNNGFEITLGWKDTIGDFNYGISGNFTRNWNLVSKYNGELVAGWVTDSEGVRTYQSNVGDVTTKVGNVRRTIEGRRINEYYLLNVYKGSGKHFNSDGSVNPAGGPKDGMIRTEGDMAWLKAMVESGNVFLPNKNVAKDGIWYGDYIYQDINGDGIYGDQNDYTFQNISQTPTMFYGFNLNLSWKGIDFAARFTGAAGGAVYWNFPGYNCYAMAPERTIAKDIAYNHYFYDPENPDDIRTNLTAKHGRLTLNFGADQNGSATSSNPSNLWLYNTDYLKLQNLTLGYTFPQKWLKKIKMQHARVFISADNVYTFTSFPGMDPAFSNVENYYASLRQYSVGLNIKF